MALSDIDQYFTLKKVGDIEQMIFTGDKCSIYIPKRYEDNGVATFGDIVTTMGLFDIDVGGCSCGLTIPCMIKLKPSEIHRVTIKNAQYIQGIFYKGDVFLLNTSLIEDSTLLYKMFTWFLSLGDMPPFVTYDKSAVLFDTPSKLAGVSFDINHSIMEMVFAHLYRDRDDLAKQYRYTDKTKPPKLINLRNVSYAPDSATGRLIGSYFQDGINAAMLDEGEGEVTDIERLMRA